MITDDADEPTPVYWYCNACGDEVQGEFDECCDNGEIVPSYDEGA